MSYHGKLQVLKNGTADAEIQLWAYQQLEQEPVAKTLTDEEILQTWKEFDDNDSDNWFIEIARAILKKASEK